MRLYRNTNQLPYKTGKRRNRAVSVSSASNKQINLQEYPYMSKEALIQALMRARITETRLKKGYEVKDLYKRFGRPS